MSSRLKIWFENYWPSLLTGPALTIYACFYIYGDTYLASVSNFFWMTLIWMCAMFILSGGSLWFRSVMLHRFKKTDDWAKRIFLTLLGYLSFAAVPNWLIFQFLKILPFAQLIPDENRFYTIWIIPIAITFLYAAVYECITYFSKWKEAISEAEQLEKLNIESQFRSLQGQLSPHFLFNSFNVLSSLIAENPRRAEDFVDELSKVYRYLLRSNEQELVSVGDELRFIHSFFYLLQTRHGAGILLKTEIPAAIYQQKLPSLGLQILVENAVKHNEISIEKPLLIEIFLNKENQIVVRNNIQRKKTHVMSTRVGLSNLEERYKLLGVSGFAIRMDVDFFEVSLPLLASFSAQAS